MTTDERTKLLALDLSTVPTGYAYRDAAGTIRHGRICPARWTGIPVERISDISEAVAALAGLAR